MMQDMQIVSMDLEPQLHLDAEVHYVARVNVIVQGVEMSYVLPAQVGSSPKDIENMIEMIFSML